MIHYYVGILIEERKEFEMQVESFNAMDSKYHVKVKNEYDDPDGYYTFEIEANNWDSYQVFIELPFIRSLSYDYE